MAKNRSGICEKCGKWSKNLYSHRWQMKGRTSCERKNASSAQEGECPKCGKYLKRLDLHLNLYPGDIPCGYRKPKGATLEEVAEKYPSVKWGQEEWYQAFKNDDGLYYAILDGIAGIKRLNKGGNL